MDDTLINGWVSGVCCPRATGWCLKEVELGPMLQGFEAGAAACQKEKSRWALLSLIALRQSQHAAMVFTTVLATYHLHTSLRHQGMPNCSSSKPQDTCGSYMSHRHQASLCYQPPLAIRRVYATKTFNPMAPHQQCTKQEPTHPAHTICEHTCQAQPKCCTSVHLRIPLPYSRLNVLAPGCLRKPLPRCSRCPKICYL